MTRIHVTHQFDPNMQPDSNFVPGTLAHLMVGNRGRMLDPRRTPMRIVGLATATGHFVLEIEGFEDQGARWEIPFERVGSYQFERGCAVASPALVQEFAAAVQQFDVPFSVPCTPSRSGETEKQLAQRRAEARAWLRDHSTYLTQELRPDLSARQGPSALWADLQRFLEEAGVADMEDEFAARFVSNPYSGEMVKGHRIVMAELGLAPFEGTVVRDPTLFDGRWSKERRTEHIFRRLAFLRAFFDSVRLSAVTLYRGLVFDGRPEPPRNETFVSASFDFEVARSCYAPRETNKSGLLMRQIVPIERLFMTYLETEPMNRQFLEAEAVLLHEPGNPLF